MNKRFGSNISVQTYFVIVIGLGGMGQQMIADLETHPQFTIAAAWDRDRSARERVKQLHPQVPVLNTLEEASLKQSDVVYIATPPNSHVDYVHKAIDMGKAVFCEKPLGIDLAKSAALVARVVKSGVANAVNFNHASSLATDETIRRLRAGQLGNISHVTMMLHLAQWPRPFQVNAEWLKYRLEGGFTREVISHWLYFCRRLFGPGQLLESFVNFPGQNQLAETAVFARLEFASIPVFLNAAVGGIGPVGMEFTLWAEKTSCRLTSSGTLSISQGDDWITVVAKEDASLKDPIARIDNFISLLEGRENTVATIQDAFEIQKLIEAILANP